MDKLSYALGLSMGNNFIRSGVSKLNADDFAKALSEVDKLILLEIYPAREEPIPGVESEMLLDKISNQNKHLIAKEQLVEWVANRIKQSEQPIAVLTLGAGDIDRLVKDIKNLKNG